MLFPKLFNHGNLRSVKVEEGKVTFEGVYGKETFEGGSGDVHGIPSGGTSGQVLSKSSATDYDAGWSDVNQVPSDGTLNQVLTKGESGYGWSDINAVPSDGTQGQVLTKGASGYGWETPSAGGGGIPIFELRFSVPSNSTLPSSSEDTYQNITGEATISNATIKLIDGTFPTQAPLPVAYDCLLRVIPLGFVDESQNAYNTYVLIPAVCYRTDYYWYINAESLIGFASNYKNGFTKRYYFTDIRTYFNQNSVPTSAGQSTLINFRISDSPAK